MGAVELTDALMACAVLPPTNQPAQVAKWRVPHDRPGLNLSQGKETMPCTSAHQEPGHEPWMIQKSGKCFVRLRSESKQLRYLR